MADTIPSNEATQVTTGAAVVGDEVFHVIQDPSGTPASAGMTPTAIAQYAEDILSLAFIVAASDETTPLTVADDKINFRMPFAFTLTDVRASVTTAPTGAAITVDIEESGTTILSTLLTIDATEKTSTTAATPAVISDAALADDAEISINIDQIGSSVAGAGLKITFIGTKT